MRSVMRSSSALLPALLLCLNLAAQAAEQCTIEPVSKSATAPSPWITQDNWLAPENLRIGLQSPGSFMPYLNIKAPAAREALRSVSRQLDLQRIKVIDPNDQQPRDLQFLLNTRLYADGLLVLRNGKIVSEQYWNGLTVQQPHLLLGGTRPLLSMMGAITIGQGKFSPDHSVVRQIPALATQAGLRKLSIQRLLEDSSRFAWTPQELAEWQSTGGWKTGTGAGGMHAWLSQAQRWDRKFSEEPFNSLDPGPEGDVLAWALSEAHKTPLSKIFCDEVFSKLQAEHPARWLTDVQGTELSGGLALTLRDFARLGQMLIDVRNGSNRSKIPGWFLETLTSSLGGRRTNADSLRGLPAGSESRYGFVHLGGAPNRVVMLGAFGSSLYMDFDRRLVIAIFASAPASRSAGTLATLTRTWEALEPAAKQARKR